MLGALGKSAVVLGLVVFAVSVGTSTGAFTTADLSRPSDVRLGSAAESLVGLDVTNSVSVACTERLVTVTNHFDHQATFEVTMHENRDGDVTLNRGAPPGTSVSFTLSPGESETVYVTNVRGPTKDDVAFDVTATTATTHVTVSKQVPKVPGNEDGDDEVDENDGNRGGRGCSDGWEQD